MAERCRTRSSQKHPCKPWRATYAVTVSPPSFHSRARQVLQQPRQGDHSIQAWQYVAPGLQLSCCNHPPLICLLGVSSKLRAMRELIKKYQQAARTRLNVPSFSRSLQPLMIIPCHPVFGLWLEHLCAGQAFVQRSCQQRHGQKGHTSETLGDLPATYSPGVSSMS